MRTQSPEEELRTSNTAPVEGKYPINPSVAGFAVNEGTRMRRGKRGENLLPRHHIPGIFIFVVFTDIDHHVAFEGVDCDAAFV